MMDNHHIKAMCESIPALLPDLPARLPTHPDPFSTQIKGLDFQAISFSCGELNILPMSGPGDHGEGRTASAHPYSR